MKKANKKEQQKQIQIKSVDEKNDIKNITV